MYFESKFIDSYVFLVKKLLPIQPNWYYFDIGKKICIRFGFRINPQKRQFYKCTLPIVDLPHSPAPKSKTLISWATIGSFPTLKFTAQWFIWVSKVKIYIVKIPAFRVFNSYFNNKSNSTLIRFKQVKKLFMKELTYIPNW